MVHVRPIRNEDAPGLRKVLDEVSRERKYLGRLEAPPEEKFRAFVESIVESGHSQFVAEGDGQIVGWCDALPGTVSAGTAHVCHLGMGVLKKFRSRGISRRLAEATIKKARARGLEKIELSVYSSNDTAIALYRNLGFQEEGRKVRGRLVDGIYDDVVLMALALVGPNQSLDPTFASGTSRAGHEPRHR
jgi:ribosomal protein S18 acetylase RimI-like enzyme